MGVKNGGREPRRPFPREGKDSGMAANKNKNIMGV
jgi:hypothetical protein